MSARRAAASRRCARADGWGRSALLLVLAAVGVLGCQAQRSGEVRRFAIQALWLQGSEADRPAFDQFMACLLGSSNLASYFQGEAVLDYRGSSVIAPPAAALPIESAGPFLAALIESGKLPGAPAEATPVYLIFGPLPLLSLQPCGQFDVQAVAGRETGVALVRTWPLCWPGTTALRNETQLGQHELVEVIDTLLGYAGCAADGACEGGLGCAGACGNLTGLRCPGAPTGSFTGCDATPVDGWVVQKLGYTGRRTEACLACFPCDFTVELRAEAGTAAESM